MYEIDKVAWIEITNGKILSTRSKGKDKFYLPGGKRYTFTPLMFTSIVLPVTGIIVHLRMEASRLSGFSC